MFAFVLFAFVASITPGPTNLIVLSTSAQRGWRPCVPIIFGAGAGAALLVWAVGTGAGSALLLIPGLRPALTVLGLGWMLWLAWRIFTAPVTPIEKNPAKADRPMGWLGAVLLQWVNPKSWIMALAVISVFMAEGQPLGQLTLAFFLVALPCLGAWALLGRGAARWLDRPRQMRWFNRVLALLLVISSAGALLHP
ncbi:LysE family translocator [Pseudomonas massiliensis]|uniref:LysE family translocator n=1 Tax=Pseudomonas massiliensis TaxID=522492 RepID=UPI00058D3C3B|nr:LysE family translocator [Pseudomonas massiliensis]